MPKINIFEIADRTTFPDEIWDWINLWEEALIITEEEFLKIEDKFAQIHPTKEFSVELLIKITGP